jgi:hypothetical protein
VVAQPQPDAFQLDRDWEFESITLRRGYGTSAEIHFSRDDGRRLLLTLTGVRTESCLLELLNGVDHFEIARADNLTPYQYFGKYVARFHRNDDLYETFLDGFEVTETPLGPGGKRPETLSNRSRKFVVGFLTAAFIVALLNLVPYLLTRGAYRIDGFEVIGFPWTFRRFGYFYEFDAAALAADLAVGLIVAVFVGKLAQDFRPERTMH